MNRETEKLLAQLEQATSPHLVGADELDTETRAMREGWLALEQALRTPDQHARRNVPAAAKKREPRQAYAIIAISIVLFVAVVGGSLSLSRAVLISIQSQFAQSQARAATGVGNDSERSVIHQNPELAWDDSFDHRLTAARIALWQATEGQEVHEWNFLRGELLEIRDELTRSSL